MAMHTQNVREDGRCSLFVMQAAADGDPLGAARATLIGNAAVVAEEEKAAVREIYLARHENSRYWWTLRTSISFGWSRWTCTTWADSA